MIGASEGFQQWLPLIEDNVNIQKLMAEPCSKYAYLANVSLPDLNEIFLRGIDLNADSEFTDFFSGIKGRARGVKVHLIHYPPDTRHHRFIGAEAHFGLGNHIQTIRIVVAE